MNDYPLIKFAIVFIIGILLLPVIKINIVAVGIIFLFLVLLLLISKRKNFFNRLNFLSTFAAFLLILSLGNITSQLHQKHFNPIISNIYKEKNAAASGTVKKIELKKKKEIVFELEANEFIANDISISDELLLLCKLRGDTTGRNEFYEKVKPGYKIEIKGMYIQGRGLRNPGEFDYNSYLKSKGITGIIIINNYADINIIEKTSDKFGNFIFNVRKYIDKQIRYFHNEETTALLKGLLLADRTEINWETKTQFINSGVVHVLAVSGLHVGFIALIFLILFGRFSIYLRSLLTISGLLFFMFLTGMPPSVFRATVMALVIIFAFLTNRSTNIFNSLASAAIIILILNPNEIYSPGFQLSFSAVAAIGIIYPIISRYINKLHIQSKIMRGLLLFLAVSFAAQVGTLPFTLIYFGKLSVIALAANLIVIPMIGIIISLAVIVLVFGLISPSIAFYYSVLNDVVSWLMLKLISISGDLSFSHLKIVGYSLYDAIIFYFLIGIFLYFVIRFKHKLAILLLFIFTFANIFLFSLLDDQDLLPDNQLSILMVDVGQGDAFIIKFPNNKTALIDAGQATYYFDNGERVILPLLNYLGINKIDYGFISHIDLDHYGGFVSLILQDKIEEIYKPLIDTSLAKDIRFEKFLKQKNVPYTYYNKQLLKVGNSRIYILNNQEEEKYYNLSSNNKSGVLKIVYGNSSFLFTGDAEKLEEKILMDDYQSFLDVDLLKVGHHGSETSSSDKFIEITSPKYALVSAGIKNSFGHPSGNVIAKFNYEGSKILRTDKSGAVLITSNGDDIVINNWR